MPELLALSVRQPWAWAILHAGKDVENRKWRAPAELLGRRIAIHASKAQPTHDDISRVCTLGRQPVPDRLPLGVIVGTVVLLGCGETIHSRWHEPGRWGWRLEDPRPLAELIPCTGRLGFWKPPAAVADQLRRALACP